MNKLLLALVATTVLLGSLFSAAANANEWVLVSESTANSKFYVNTYSMKKRKSYEAILLEGGSVVRTQDHMEAWWKVVEPNGTYTQIQSRFYCNERASKDISKVKYSASNTYLSSPRVSSYANTTVPNTAFAEVSNYVCPWP